MIPIEKVLLAANLTKDDINVVELIGGGIRVPKV
jgi:molecular chaperone DnaK (HSP70)